jgi:Pyruvate/2-oxoacid:ferredoxin oxidoreductase delta subunit
MEEKTVYTQLAEQIGAGASKIVPRIFESLITEDEGRLLLAAAPPATAAELSEKTGIAVAKIESMTEPLFRKGLLFKSKKPDGIRYYRVRQVFQLHDSTAVMQDPPQLMLDLWKEFMRTEWNDSMKLVESIIPHAAVRVIPINTAVEPSSQVLAMDDVSKLIEGARRIAVTKCSCRVIDGACGKPLEVCIQLDRAADYSIERGTGRPLTREQVLRILEQCEEEGLVHVAENKQGVGNVICNCCNDCCINWTSIRSGLGKFVAPSRFRAAIRDEDCNGCELCVDRCFFEAMHMVEADTLAAVDQDKCMGCGVCRVVCPTDAISMELIRPQEFIPA